MDPRDVRVNNWRSVCAWDQLSQLQRICSSSKCDHESQFNLRGNVRRLKVLREMSWLRPRALKAPWSVWSITSTHLILGCPLQDERSNWHTPFLLRLPGANNLWDGVQAGMFSCSPQHVRKKFGGGVEAVRPPLDRGQLTIECLLNRREFFISCWFKLPPGFVSKTDSTKNRFIWPNPQIHAWKRTIYPPSTLCLQLRCVLSCY